MLFADHTNDHTTHKHRNLIKLETVNFKSVVGYRKKEQTIVILNFFKFCVIFFVVAADSKTTRHCIFEFLSNIEKKQRVCV